MADSPDNPTEEQEERIPAMQSLIDNHIRYSLFLLRMIILPIYPW